MLTLVFIALGLLFAWLAWDAWRLRGGIRLPYAELLKLRGLAAADHLPLVKRAALQREDERRYGRTDATFLVFTVFAVGFLAGAIDRLLG